MKRHSPLLFCALATTLLAPAMVAGDMVGLSLVENSPVGYKLVSVNESSGVVGLLGGADQPVHSEMAGTGDLCAVDKALGVWYYLGDTSAGTTLVGLSMDDGAEVCASVVPSLAEIGIVGAGQSLDFDDSTDNGSLVLSGVSTANGTKHMVLRLPLGDGARRTIADRKNKKQEGGGGGGVGGGSSSVPGCGAGGNDAVLEVLGYFGDDAYLPFVHASTIDSAGQRLFVTLQLGDDEVSTNELAVAVVDLVNGEKNYYSVPMDEVDHVLYGIDYDAQQQRLVGVVINAQNTGLSLRSLVVGSSSSKKSGGAVAATAGNDPVGTWSTLPIAGTPRNWKFLGGNAATVSSLDESGRLLYFEAGDNVEMSLGVVNVDSAELVASPTFSGDTPISSTGLTMISHF